MRVLHGMATSLLAVVLSAAAGAQVPATATIDEFIVTAKSPASSTDETDIAAHRPTPFVIDQAFDPASMLKELHAEQGRALTDAIAMLPDGESLQ